MDRTPSRKEKREAKFYRIAENGYFFCNNVTLFKSEARLLITKDGFDAKRLGESEKKSLPSVVSWKEAFKGNIPLIVSEYIEGKIQTFPNSAIKNWAQELYVIAARANYEKGTNINE